MMDSELLTFGRLAQRRDELLLVTRSDIFLLDVRAPGRFIAREAHAIDFKSGSSTEITFSPSGTHVCIWCTGMNDPKIFLLGPIPSIPAIQPHIHRQQINLGLRLDNPHPLALRVTNPVTPYDDLHGQRDPMSFNLTKPVRRGKSGLRRLYHPAGFQLPPQHDGSKLASILAVGFWKFAKQEVVATIGTSYCHLKKSERNRFSEPILLYRELLST